MEFQQVVRRRRMVRTYEPDPVDPAVLERMVHNATRAPNAGFSQGWAFLVLDEPADVTRFWSATTPPGRAAEPSSWLRGMRTAPAVVVPLSNKGAYLGRYAEPDKGWTAPGHEPWPMPYWHIDTGMAALLILQTAVDEGLGACFFGIPGERTGAFREEFGVPQRYTPIGAITVGHPAQDSPTGGSARRRERKPLDAVVHRGRWTT